MILLMKAIWKCMSSPRLYKIYGDGPYNALYQPNGVERWSDKIIISAHTLLNITLYASPFICFYIYRRGFFTYDECKSMAYLFGGIGCFLSIAFLLRAIGRATDSKYMQFLRTLDSKTYQQADTYVENVRKYDFDFSAWPTSFKMPEGKRADWLQVKPFATTANDNIPYYRRVFIQMLAFIAVHTFALRLVYPGSLSVVHNLLWFSLLQGRTKLVESHSGERAKIKTADGNFLDTMFVDNRWSYQNGEILVICCEGNSGFYEIGIMTSPIRIGYSAIGWNHPGFAESTGLPYTSQEHNAIDAVMQYAIKKLNFRPDKIVMFGWSIGGYSAAWAAARYPVRGVILDATFDDLLPLAQNQMPAWWSLLVKEVIRSYLNLHVAEALKKYSGPIQLVRRTDDEIICLRPGHYGTNRGNYLLIEIMRQRHPEIIRNHLSLLIRYTNMLGHKRPILNRLVPDDDALVLKYVHRYTRDFKSSHCSPLPSDLFMDIMKQVLKR